ncbi:MAG: hypothetical protein OIF34_00550, partial [Porticoccaceae bacterium]|nr:hypothetical protein [Porticoccaceae bacterium]
MNTERTQGEQPTHGTTQMHQEDLDNLIKEYDNESNFRDLRGGLKHFVTLVCVSLSVFHIYTAGFGLLNEVSHRTVHMTMIMGLLFLVFPRKAAKRPKVGIALGLMYGLFYLLIAHQLVSALGNNLSWVINAGIYLFAGMMALSALPLSFLGGRGNKPGWLDWPLAILGAGFSGYLVYFFDEIFIINVGFPQTMDYLMGGVAILMVI